MGSDNGLVPKRRQAIIWTNDDPVQRRIYASLGLNELTHINHKDQTDFFSNKVSVTFGVLVAHNYIVNGLYTSSTYRLIGKGISIINQKLMPDHLKFKKGIHVPVSYCLFSE